MVVFGGICTSSSSAARATGLRRTRKATRSNCSTGRSTPAVVPERPTAATPVTPDVFEDVLVDCGAVLERTGASALAGRYTTSIRIEDELSVENKALGCGKSGAVKLGRWRDSAAQCAVKTFSKKQLDKLGRVDLKNELETYLVLDHPHIATLERVYETETDVHVVMECLEGGEVFERLAQKTKFSEGEASEAVRQMLLAIAYMHSHGFVHRDIKLENFVYEARGGNHLKLIDFGFARRFSADSPKMRHANGTFHYMAPEVLRRCYTEKADLWSVGICAYMLLCGGAPWSCDEAETMQMIAAGTPHYWPWQFDPLGAGAKDFVRSLLVADPQQRLSAVQALEHPWLRRAVSAEVPNAIIMQSLHDFSQTSQKLRSCVAISVWSVSAQSQAWARQHFLGLASTNGGITADSLQKALEASDVAGADAEMFFRILDANGDGEISWSEFLAASLGGLQVIGAETDGLRRAFGRFDDDMLSAVISSDGNKATLDDFCTFVRMPLAHHSALEPASALAVPGASSFSSRVQSFSSSVSEGSMEQNFCVDVSSNFSLKQGNSEMAKYDEPTK